MSETSTITSTTALSLDTVFEVLSVRRNRYVLYALYRADEQAMTVPRLAERVRGMEAEEAVTEHARSPADIAGEIRRHHVPWLAEMGVVEYDERSDTVRYHRMPSLEEWLEHAEYKEGKHPER